MSQPKSNEGHVAYSPEINAVRAVLVKYLNEYPADLLADLAQLLTEQKDEAVETAFKSAIKICELGNIKPPKSNEDMVEEISKHILIHEQYRELVKIGLRNGLSKVLAQKDAEVEEAVRKERDMIIAKLKAERYVTPVTLYEQGYDRALRKAIDLATPLPESDKSE